MNMEELFRSILEQDAAPIVVCAADHTIVYMNPSAKERYSKRGGEALLGKKLTDCHNAESNAAIERVFAWFRADKSHNRVFTFRNEKENKDVYMIALRAPSGELIGYYEKHEYRTPEAGKRYDLS